MNTPALRFDNAKKIVPVGFWGKPTTILHGASFSVEVGEIHGLIGHNGAGKSTSLRMLTGCSRPNDGSVAVFGEDPASPAARWTATKQRRVPS